MPTLGEDVNACGWCTGCVFPFGLPADLENRLLHPGQDGCPIGPDDWIVVVSQACDVVARTADQEPFVEVLHCHPRQGIRSQFARLRSTRRIDFYPNRDSHQDLVLTAHATADRYYLPRELLAA